MIAPDAAKERPFLSVEDLSVAFPTEDGLVRAVDGVTFTLERGKTLAIVGESGSGKSVTAQAIMGLHNRKATKITGEIWLDDQELVHMPLPEVQDLRGNEMAMIFQDPMSSLHPFYRIGDQITEAIRVHRKISKAAARQEALDMLRHVGIPAVERRIDAYPHQLSGGMRQRVMIAMALSTNPVLLIADEPTTALDVTIQAQILELMKEMRQTNGTAIMLITHDLGVVAEMADDVVVMYAGKVVEMSTVTKIFETPHHPYTKGLLASIPRLGDRRTRLAVIEGTVPNPLNLPTGCLFKRRCPYAMPICDTAPPLQEVGPDHVSRCWLTPEGAPPEVGAAAPPDVAEAAAVALSVGP